MKKLFEFMNFYGLLVLLSSCCSFNKEIAIKEFNELKPNGEIINLTDYECSGSTCVCWYVEIKYKMRDSSRVYDTIFQYWPSEEGWITRKEHDKRIKY